MSFTIVKKSTRRMIGVITAMIITGILVYAFLDSYAKAKRMQVPKTDLVELNIVADQAAAATTILYEAVPGEECIKQITFNHAVSSVALSHAASSVVVKNSTAVTQSSSAKPKPSEPKLIQASSPKCITQTPAPNNYQQLGKDGFISLELNLAADGRVERGEVEKSSGFEALDAAALKQVTETWLFEPCKKSNAAVACKTHIRFRWEVK